MIISFAQALQIRTHDCRLFWRSFRNEFVANVLIIFTGGSASNCYNKLESMLDYRTARVLAVSVQRTGDSCSSFSVAPDINCSAGSAAKKAYPYQDLSLNHKNVELRI